MKGILSPVVLLTCATVAAVLVAIFVAVVVAHARTARALGGIERFLLAPESWPSPDALHNDRGDAYARAGLSQFYSSGVGPQGRAFFMPPSSSDVVALMGFSGTGVRPERAPETVDRVACQDSAFPRGGVNDGTCTSVVSSRAPAESACKVRVYDSTYKLTKACLKTDIVAVSQRSPSAGRGRGLDPVVMQLPASASSSALLVLLRPSFASTSSSVVYRVKHPNTTAGDVARNTTADYDSDRPDALRVEMERVTDPAVADLDAPSMDRSLGAVGGVAVPAISLDLFFLRFHERLPVRADDPYIGRVLTAFHVMPSQFPSGYGRVLLSLAGPVESLTISVDADADGTGDATLALSLESRMPSYAVAIPPGSLVVVTFTDDIALVAAMTAQRVVFRRYAMPRAYRASDYGGVDAVAAAIRTAAATPPAGMAPYGNDSIPDLADVALRYRALPAARFI